LFSKTRRKQKGLGRKPVIKEPLGKFFNSIKFVEKFVLFPYGEKQEKIPAGGSP
jgi:hypothetical protein